MNNKYEFTGDTLVADDGAVLHRIKALVSLADVDAGDLGGWIEKEENLDSSGDAWLHGDAQVYGNARVSGDAQVSGNAWGVSPLQVQPSKYYINMVNATELRIGCQVHTIAWWLENNERHAAETGETPELAAEMRLYIELAARRYAPELLEVVANEQ